MNTPGTTTLAPRPLSLRPRGKHPGFLTTLLLLAVLGGCGGSDGDGGGDNEPPPPPGDTTAPTVPQSVAAVADSTAQVSLSWAASTDSGAGVAGYRIYRDGGATPIATVTTGTAHVDTGLTAATLYSYTVSAFDSASPANESAQSTAVTVTTLQPTGQLGLTTERVFPNLPAFESPVLALQAPGDGSTWYVVEQAGRVIAFADDSAVNTKHVFLDITGRVQDGGERGLLGMAFHPQFPTVPRVYLSYTTLISGELVSRISSFEYNAGPNTLNPASETILLTVDQPAANHNGGNIAFGPADGLLYIGFGDGGGANDDWGDIGNGQELNTVLGKMLRIDVSGTTSSTVLYRIPADNPYEGNTPCNEGSGAQPCPEIFAYGFRNPWRWSFDRVDHVLWLGDVGEASIEEVNRVALGGNYGWRCFEGTMLHSNDCGPNQGVALAPVAEYTHDVGSTVTGGFVYRGALEAQLHGRYVFGDYGNGLIWHIARDREPTREMTAGAASETGLAIASFAEDAEGELYIVDYGGTLHRVMLVD